MAFSDEAIRRVVATAEYSDPRAVEMMVSTLIRRRDKVGREWLTAVNPVVDFRIDANNTLMFENAAVAAGLSTAGGEYRVRWFRFDNTTGELDSVGPAQGVEQPAVAMPTQLIRAEFLAADVAGVHPHHPVWARPVRVYFHRLEHGWRLVGVERTPGAAS